MDEAAWLSRVLRACRAALERAEETDDELAADLRQLCAHTQRRLRQLGLDN